VAAVLAQPALVDAIRDRIADRLDALSFAAALAPREVFALDFTRASPLTDAGAARLAAALAAGGQVVGLNLAFSSALDISGIGHVARLLSLRSLDLAGTVNLDDEGAHILRPLTALTALCLAHSGCGDAGLASVCGHLRALKSLDLTGCKHVTAAGVSRLSSLALLTSLRSPRIRAVDEQYSSSRSPSLKKEALALSAVLRSLPALESLASPSHSPLGLYGNSAVRNLTLSCCTADDWREIVSAAPAVTFLELDMLGVVYKADCLSLKDMAQLASGLPSLAHLSLSHADFQGGAHGAWLGLASATGITELEICGCSFGRDGDGDGDGDVGFVGALLPALPLIAGLTVLGVPFVDGDLAAIGRHLPHRLRSLRFGSRAAQQGAAKITFAGFAELAACSALTKLHFYIDEIPSDAAAAGAALAAIAAAAPLRELGIAVSGLSGELDLAAFRQLTALELERPSRAVQAALPALRGSPLVRLSLKYVELTDTDLSLLEALSQLTALEVGVLPPSWLLMPGVRTPGISDAGLRDLTVALTGLRELGLYLPDVGITDAGLEALCALPRLRRLQLRLGAITAAGVARVEQQLPSLLRVCAGAYMNKRVEFGDYEWS